MSAWSDRGVTLIELLITLLLFAVLMTATAYSINPIFLAWSNQQDRMGLQRSVQDGIDKGIRHVRKANALQNDVNHAIRFTVRESGVQNSYILYLYNSANTWPPAYNQTRYELREATLVGGIGGTFTYGSGTLFVRGVSPPPTSDLAVSGSVATLDLTLNQNVETFHLIERAKRRNF